ncbi:MAG: 8-oxoguanine DNA glycosylase [Ezakiella sp.]|nr:8-oxoguanine DNA glycosylase [Ezakiella sp.]MDY3947626.1 8-oxoguanine DNA glycosylase [Ezakiella sp.]
MKTIKYDKPAHFNIKDICESGQVFMYKEYEDGYLIQTKDKRAKISEDGEFIYITSSDHDLILNYLDYYYDYENDFNMLKEMGFPKDILSFSDGIRILKQDLEEIVYSFIISQNNNIKRIKKIISNLLIKTNLKASDEFGEYYLFPSSKDIAKLELEELREMGLGYRDKYIYNTSRFLSDNPDFLEKIKLLNTKEAHNELVKLSGVGPKVADCILLYGMNRRDTFPLDTWMAKVFKEQFYDEKNRVKMADFATKKYGNLAGLAQQLYFFHIRENSK